MQAVSIASKIKHTDVYHQDINYNVYIYYTIVEKTNNATNKMSC